MKADTDQNGTIVDMLIVFIKLNGRNRVYILEVDKDQADSLLNNRGSTFNHLFMKTICSKKKIYKSFAYFINIIYIFFLKT